MSPTRSAERKPRRAAGLAGGVWAAVLLVAAAAAAAERDVYVVDTGKSSVHVFVSRAGLLGFLGHDHEFEAPLSEGRVDVAPADPAHSQVDLHWKAADLAVVPGTEPADDVPTVEKRMRGPEVLDAAAHPGIRFWSFEVQVEKSDPAKGEWTLHVKGGLEVKGGRHTVEVPLEVRLEGDTLVASGEAKLRLSRLGIEPPSVAGVVKVADRFRIRFQVEASRSPAGNSTPP